MANIQLADNLRRLRKQYNYTQAQIGKKDGVKFFL